VQGSDGCTPGLAQLGQLRNGAALLSKIGTAESACLRHDFGRCIHRKSPKLVLLAMQPVKPSMSFQSALTFD
jgi:hypothetical protein